MRVLMQSRVTLFTGPGGDTTQICCTAEALRKLGVHCEISTELEPDLSEWDIVHLFNLVRPQEVYLQARNAVRQGKPVVLSTIYLSGLDFDRSARGGVIGFLSRLLPANLFESVKVVARGILNSEWHAGSRTLIWHGYRRLQEDILRMTSICLPNSRSEWQRVVRDFPLASAVPSAVVPNAVDLATFGNRGNASRQPSCGEPKVVLCASNIGPRKNQLRLIRAMKGLDIPLWIVGQPSPNAWGYYRRMQTESGLNVRFIGHVPHEELPPYYRAAKVHVLASWMETTGLCSLEAALCGCNLVITEKGDTREYFEDMAWYCDPASEESIREAILQAYHAPVSPALETKIRSEYTWERAAEVTLEAYCRAVDGHSGTNHTIANSNEAQGADHEYQIDPDGVPVEDRAGRAFSAIPHDGLRKHRTGGGA